MALFHSKLQKVRLVEGFTRYESIEYIHPDMVSIIFAFYWTPYSFLDSLGIEYDGLEPALSRLLRHMTLSLAHEATPIRILLHGTDTETAQKIARAFSTKLGFEHFLSLELPSLFKFNYFNRDINH